MGYKEKLGKGIVTVFDTATDSYFLSLGFYVDVMEPRFGNGEYYGKLIRQVPALLTGFEDDKGHWHRIFINPNEIYIEVENKWRGFLDSYHYPFENPPCKEDVEKALDYLFDEWLD